MINTKLKAIADYIDHANTIADIGTDHAYLPIYLIQEGKATRVIASDINSGPIKIANKNINKNNMQDKIETRKGSGLDTLAINEADVIIISGMGGMLIKDILTAHMDIAKAAAKLIIQPQKDNIGLRNFLYSHGFSISDEILIKDEGKFYEIIVSKYDGKIAEPEIYSLSRRISETASDITIDYLENKIEEVQKILNIVNKKNNIEAQKKYNKDIEYYKEVLKWQKQTVKR